MTADDLAGQLGDAHAVAITKRAIAALEGRSITPDTISKKAWEIDDGTAEPRGVSTYTLRNNPLCRALLDRYRTYRQAPRRRRRGGLPAHIVAMSKRDLITALLDDGDRSMRADCALSQLAVSLLAHGRPMDRAKLDAIGEARASLEANRVPGRASAKLTERTKRSHERSERLIRAALVALAGKADFTHADVLREAKVADKEGRGLHDDILERNAFLASLVREAAGSRPVNPPSADRPKHLARLANHTLGRAVMCERGYYKAAERLLAKYADIVVDLELAAVIADTVERERTWVREQAELRRDLETLGLA